MSELFIHGSVTQRVETLNLYEQPNTVFSDINISQQLTQVAHLKIHNN